MTYTFFNQKFANCVNEVLSWFGINLMASFQNITETCIAIWQKSHIQLTFKFTISTWSLLLSYIDDTLSVYCAICY